MLGENLSQVIGIHLAVEPPRVLIAKLDSDTAVNRRIPMVGVDDEDRLTGSMICSPDPLE
jgi:hypothetical protein